MKLEKNENFETASKYNAKNSIKFFGLAFFSFSIRVPSLSKRIKPFRGQQQEWRGKQAAFALIGRVGWYKGSGGWQ